MQQRLIPYLQLLRLPTVFTAMADIFLGFLLTHDSFDPYVKFVMLLVASSSLYLSGMVLNDIFDRRIDAIQRPERPIPSDRISLASAIKLAVVLVLVGLGAAQVVGTNSAILAGILTLCIIGYDAVLKKTPLGPLAMGACRFLNVILGASAVESSAVLWRLPQLHVASGLGLYIVGVTWFARQEALQSPRRQLLGATCVVNLGLATLIGFLMHTHGENRMLGLFVLGVIGLTINRRMVAACFKPAPRMVQLAIKTMLLSLVMLDATIVLFANGKPINALATAALLIPAIVLGRWIRLT